MLLARAGRVDEAVTDLRQYLEREPDARDAERVRLLLEDLGK
jgi:regulator of sirC expression with transglutaminase-like and TPR domain